MRPRIGRVTLCAVALALTAMLAAAPEPAVAQSNRGVDNPISAFFGAIFGGGNNRQQPQAVQPRRTRPSQTVPNRSSRPRRADRNSGSASRSRSTRPANTAPRRPAKVAKDPEAIHVVVFGGKYAAGLAEGLTQAFADDSGVQIVDAAAAGAGLVEQSPEALQQTVRAYLADPEKKIGAAVIMAGENDRKPISTGSESTDFGTERWRDLYAQRVESMMQIFLVKQVPLYWVGLPPVADSDTSGDYGFFNEIFRARSYRTGADFVDIWNGFVDEKNAYAQSGPDLNGEIRQLRSDDGNGFTSAGNRKLAHFVARELRRDLVRGGETVEAAPTGTEGPTPYRPSEEAVRTGLGPIVPLGAAPRPGELLAGGLDSEPSPPEDSAFYRVIVQGRTPDPQPGRSDDFSWPPPSASGG